MTSERDLERRGGAKGRQSNYISSSYGIEDDYDSKWPSWLVPIFVVINVVIFIVVMRINNCPHKTHGCVARFLGRLSFQPLRENPLFGPSSSTLLKLGGLQNIKVVHDHQVWRLFTCLWLHAGVVHLLSNMLCLFFIGVRLEQQFGFVRIGIIYLLSGIGGSVLSSIFIQNSISVGASGALFGLLGAMLSELITNWTLYSNKVAAFLTLLFIIVINLAIGILPYVNNFAHIGGFVSGFLLGFVLLPRPQFAWRHRHNISTNNSSRYKIYQYVLCFIALALLIVGFTMGLILVFRGADGNRHCRWCHYLSCVPTSRWSCNNDR